MAKAYVQSSNAVRDGEDWRETIHFDSHAENAARWHSAESAEVDCADLNRGVTIRSMDGRTHVIDEFRVEEMPDGDFAISCDLPFIGQ